MIFMGLALVHFQKYWLLIENLFVYCTLRKFEYKTKRNMQNMSHEIFWLLQKKKQYVDTNAKKNLHSFTGYLLTNLTDFYDRKSRT